MINNKQIEDLLQDEMKFLCKIIPEKQVLGVFTHGLLNYGFAESENEIETLMLYIPTFEEMCISPTTDELEYINYKNRKIRKVDFRLLYNYMINQNSTIMEALFSDNYIINPRYSKVFKKYIQMNKEGLYRCDQKAKVNDIVTRARNAINDYVSAKRGNEALFEACRLRIACRLYLDGVSCENCIYLKRDYHINYLWQIKRAELCPDINEIKNDLDNFLEEAKGLKINNTYRDLIKTSVKEVIKIALTDMNQERDFRQTLTDMEKQALSIILDNLDDGHEGNISISQLVADSSISRPVFKNVLQKMKDNLIAEIENKGVKGTYVKIMDGILLSE